MKLYEIKNEIAEISVDQIAPDALTVGIITSEELTAYGTKLGFDEETISASQKANPIFRTGVDVHGHYTFAELKIIDRKGAEDYISIYLKKNLFIVVDIFDEDKSTFAAFTRALRKYSVERISLERIVYGFIDMLLTEGNMVNEELRNMLTDKEEEIVDGTADQSFNSELLEIKKKITRYYNFYQQILDVTETFEENDNEILDESKMIYISNLTNKVTRLSSDMDSLNNIADHLQDAYATLLDQRMNNTMKIFIIITTIFFPLTIIVGWYGMNFTTMPELGWKYGYAYVTILSVVVVVLLVWIGKKKKWF